MSEEMKKAFESAKNEVMNNTQTIAFKCSDGWVKVTPKEGNWTTKDFWNHLYQDFEPIFHEHADGIVEVLFDSSTKAIFHVDNAIYPTIQKNHKIYLVD